MTDRIDLSPPDGNLMDLIQDLKKKKAFIAAGTLLFLVLGILYIFIVTPQYKSYVSIYPTLDESTLPSGLSDFQGIATAFGFSMESMGQVSFYVPDIVMSRRLQKSVILNRWETAAFPEPVNLIQYWEIDDQTKLIRRMKRLVMKIFPKGYPSDPQKKFIEIALEEMQERVKVDEEDSGLTRITIGMEEPRLAAEIANYMAEYIKSYIRSEQYLQSSKYRKFIEDRLKESEEDLTVSEDELTRFRKLHPIALDTPELQLSRGRLMRNIEVNQEVYITLKQQYELARIDELKETTVINILDAAEPPVSMDSPRRSLVLFLSLFGGFFLMLVYRIFRFGILQENH